MNLIENIKHVENKNILIVTGSPDRVFLIK